MSAYAGVVDHPWYAVTDATGAFTFKDLPAGEYTVEAWHLFIVTIISSIAQAGKR
jgi:hypothetical protein